MIRQTYQIEIITPCFCAGAGQSKAEIRASSIRGQLRWWFRVLGGSAEEEGTIFGSVAGDDRATSSSLSIRATDFKSGPTWNPPTINQNQADNYVWHFASVSGATQRGRTGPRWTSSGAIAPKSTFTLEILWRRSPGSIQKSAFELSLHSFLVLGTLGLRGTRGLGAIYSPQAKSLDSLMPALTKAGIVIRRMEAPPVSSYQEALGEYAAWLRYDFRKNRKAATQSPLGSSEPRQTSAIRFRPFKQPENQFSWLAYEAPHGRVLGARSRAEKPILEPYQFTGNPPQAPERRR